MSKILDMMPFWEDKEQIELALPLPELGKKATRLVILYDKGSKS